MTKAAAGRFDPRAVGMLSGAHFFHDCYPAFLGILLPLLIPKLDLSLAAAGFIASGMRWTASLQPFLGYLADRRDTRWWVILAPTVTALCMSLMGVAPGQAVLVVLLLMTGLSHAAFHPAAAAMVTRVSGDTWGKGAAWFMTAGELGRVIGPVFIAGVIAWVGLETSWIAFLPGLAASVLLYSRLRSMGAQLAAAPPPRIRDVFRQSSAPVLALSASMVLRGTPNVALLTFYPTVVVGHGSTLLAAGLALTLYEAGGTLGAFLGGTWSDRLGRPLTMILGIAVAAPLVIAALLVGPGPLAFGLLTLGGLAMLSASSVELVTMQELFPDNRSYAVGVSYLMKSIGAIIATLAVGAVAQVVGLRTTLIGTVLLATLSIPFLLALQRHLTHARRAAEPTPTAEPPALT